MTTTPYVSPRPRTRVVVPPMEASASFDPAENRGEAPRLLAEPGGARKKRLPNKGSWPKKVSGNLNGRPKGAKGVKPIVRKILSAAIPVKTARGSEKVALFEALIRKEAALAIEGDWRARRTMFELGKWAMDDGAQLPQTLGATAEELTATGQGIIDWFTDEVISRKTTGQP